MTYIDDILNNCTCSDLTHTYRIGDELPEWVSDLEGNGVIVISEDSIRYHGKYEVVVGFFGDYVNYRPATGEVSILQRTDFLCTDEYYQDSLESDLGFEYSEEVDTP